MPLLFALGAAVLAYVAVRELRAYSRRRAFAAKSNRRITEALTDPREAAAILLVQQAAYEGHISTDQKALVTGLMQQAFDASPVEAEELYAFGRAAVGQAGDAANSLRRLLRPIYDSCTLEEMKELVAMLEEVSSLDGAPTDQQRRLTAATARALSLPVAS